MKISVYQWVEVHKADKSRANRNCKAGLYVVYLGYTVLTEPLDCTLTVNVSKHLFHLWTQKKGSDLRSEVKLRHGPD